MAAAKIGSLSTRCAYKKYALVVKNLSKSQKVRRNILFEHGNQSFTAEFIWYIILVK
jgi:hypothetical protein